MILTKEIIDNISDIWIETKNLLEIDYKFSNIAAQQKVSSINKMLSNSEHLKHFAFSYFLLQGGVGFKLQNIYNQSEQFLYCKLLNKTAYISALTRKDIIRPTQCILKMLNKLPDYQLTSEIKELTKGKVLTSLCTIDLAQIYKEMGKVSKYSLITEAIMETIFKNIFVENYIGRDYGSKA